MANVANRMWTAVVGTMLVLGSSAVRAEELGEPLVSELMSALHPQLQQESQSAAARQPNIILITIDDVGVDKVGCYGEGPPGSTPPCTPNIDALAAEGILFRNAWTNPICTPTRAQLMTGRHGFRTGVGKQTDTRSDDMGLSVPFETTLPEILDRQGYDHSAVGKWHLAARDETIAVGQGLQHPLNSGFNSFAGSISNLQGPAISCGAGCTPPECGHLNYSNWVEASDPLGVGVLQQDCSTSYPSTNTTDDAIFRMQAMQPPWFLYVNYNAAHSPFHDPPLCHLPGTCSTQYCPSQGAPETRYNAMVEAMDVEIGRLLEHVGDFFPDAVVILIGDNGTPDQAADGSPTECFSPGKSKRSLFEGGINVPLIISGPRVVPREVEALVNSTDIFATIADLAGAEGQTGDSISMMPYLLGSDIPRRQFVYAEYFSPNQETPDNASTPPFDPDVHSRTVRSVHWKLMRSTKKSGEVEEKLYDLDNDECEKVDLCSDPGVCRRSQLTPEAKAAYERLRTQMLRMGVY